MLLSSQHTLPVRSGCYVGLVSSSLLLLVRRVQFWSLSSPIDPSIVSPT